MKVDWLTKESAFYYFCLGLCQRWQHHSLAGYTTSFLIHSNPLTVLFHHVAIHFNGESNKQRLVGTKETSSDARSGRHVYPPELLAVNSCWPLLNIENLHSIVKGTPSTGRSMVVGYLCLIHSL